MGNVESTLAQMAAEDSDENLGWEAGADFAKTLKVDVLEELATLKRLNYSQAYIDAWIDSAEGVFYTIMKPDGE